jgi:zinc and cadmium transporter
MDTVFIAVILASSIAGVVTTVGIYAISRFEEWGRSNTVYFMSFAAGVLVSVSFIHIIPTSFNMHAQAPLFLLAGFLSLYLFNRFLHLYICRDYACETFTVSIIPMIGIGFHSFIDGIIYSVTFNVSIFTGVFAAIGMILHEFPEGIVTFLLLERGGYGTKKALVYAFLAAAITTPLGTLSSYPFIAGVQPSTLGILLALSAGALVYVGASHLLPEVEKENKRYSLLSLMAGVLVAAVIVISKR